MDEKRIFWIIAIGIVAIFVLSSFGFTGTGQYASQGGRGINSCKDTDGGYNTRVAGTAISNDGGQEKWYPDKCSKSTGGFNLIQENYCVGTERAFRETSCPKGTTCKSGVDNGGKKYGSNAYCG